MRKRIVLTVIAIALLVCVLGVLCACESYKAKALDKVGDKNAVVESNGGLVVKQGGYLYFVNGYTGYLTEKGSQNWFGNVTKGAIVRVTYNSDGTLGDDYKVVVPKSVMASTESLGFSIYGEWIYYVSPSAEEERDGSVKTDTLQFLRTKIDGTGTQLILNWDNTSVQYKYTPKALVFYDNSESKLYSKDLSAKKFKKNKPGECIAEDVASVHFPKNESYDPAKGETIGDYVLYTKNSEDSYDSTNTLYAVDPLGNDTKTLIGATTFDAKYNVKVITSKVEGDKLSIYYTKTSYVGTSSSGTVVGTFAYQFADKSFAFDAKNEAKLSDSELSTLYPISYADGVVKTGEKSVIYYTNGAEPKTFGVLNLNTLLTVKDGVFYYLNSDKVMLYYPLSGEKNVHYAYTTGEKFMDDSSFIAAEYFDGYVYFILDDDYDYMARIRLADIDIYSDKEAAVTRVAIVTAEDQAKMDEAENESDEDSDK